MKNRFWIRIGLSFCASWLAFAPVFGQNDAGLLLLAHGGNAEWNRNVQAIAAEANKTIPAEVAFGMADRTALQEGVDKLAARGVKRIVAVPLFVSSHSSVIESIRYLFGLRPEAPSDLNLFAAMHSHPGGHGHGHGHGGDKPTGHEMARVLANVKAPPHLMKPVKLPVSLKMTGALDRHPLVAEILLDRAKSTGMNPRQEALILVAHGPNEDKENAAWLADMEALKKEITAHAPYARVACLTLRDDADAPVRDAATALLRKTVQDANDAGYRALVVPLLLSYGGIENGLRQRLDGVQHIFSPQALLPDPRITRWVLEQAGATSERLAR